MHGTTRELNFSVITFVSLVFVLLLIVIVEASTAWFRYEYRARQAKSLAEDPLQGANAELLELNAEQTAQLNAGAVTIDDAILEVAERY